MNCTAMQSPLFARPNLKLFALAAVLLAAVAQWIQPGRSEQAVLLVQACGPRSPAVVQRELEQLQEALRLRPTGALCVRIADCYRELGDLKQAVHYLRRADQLGFDEEDWP